MGTLSASESAFELPVWQTHECALLAAPPLLCHLKAERSIVLVASLSDAGVLRAFSAGLDALTRELTDSCLTGLPVPAHSTVHWHFIAAPVRTAVAASAAAWLSEWRATQDQPRTPVILHTGVAADAADITCYIPPNLYWFSGHFPDLPILPGIVQIDWAAHYSQLLGFEPRQFATMPRAKFSALIRPATVLRLRLTSKGRSLDFAYESVSGQHSRGTIRFE